MDDENENGGFQLALIGCPLVLAFALVVLLLTVVVFGAVVLAAA